MATPVQLDLRHASNHYLLSTVRTVTRSLDGTVGEATAFFFTHNRAPGDGSTYLVTNNHVVQDAAEATIVFHERGRHENNRLSLVGKLSVTFPEFQELWTPHPNPAIDLCAVSVEKLRDSARGRLDNAHISALGSHGIPDPEETMRFPAIMQIAMIGYPNGLWDSANNLPIIRRGVTASHPAIDFGGRPEVVIDMACFPGSSGSPVVFEDRQYFASAFRFLGVLASGPTITANGEIMATPVPTAAARPEVQTEVMMHLGYAIKSSELLPLVEAAA